MNGVEGWVGLVVDGFSEAAHGVVFRMSGRVAFNFQGEFTVYSLQFTVYCRAHLTQTGKQASR